MAEASKRDAKVVSSNLTGSRLFLFFVLFYFILCRRLMFRFDGIFFSQFVWLLREMCMAVGLGRGVLRTSTFDGGLFP